MELDELKASWRRLDQQVQELTLVNRRLLIDAAIRKQEEVGIQARVEPALACGECAVPGRERSG